MERAGWRRVERIGRGAQSEVWRVVRGGRTAVAKLVCADQRDNPAFRAMCAVEIEALRRIRDEAVIRLLDAGDGWLVVEEASAGAASAPPEDWAGVRELIERVDRALRQSHRAGVLHRDVKLDNVLRTERGWVLADYGAARIEGVPDPAPALGTPASMAPERLGGAEATEATDRFSLGVLAYALVCGRPPYPSRWAELIEAHAHGPPPIEPALALPPDGEVWLDWIRALLDPDPARRPGGLPRRP